MLIGNFESNYLDQFHLPIGLIVRLIVEQFYLFKWYVCKIKENNVYKIIIKMIEFESRNAVLLYCIPIWF